jgi:DNA-binding protein H-NS
MLPAEAARPRGGARLVVGVKWMRPHEQLQGNAKRPYPKVTPKFQNPEVPNQTWAGRGQQPH